jgi:hypothetical protein
MRFVVSASRRGLPWLLVNGLLCVLWASSPADKETYEKLGLSETEWNKIQEMNLPLSKVHRLLESGISIAEYCRKPWQELSISEDEYIRLRRAGHSDADVRSMHMPKHGANEWTAAQSFLLPGCNQIRRHKVRGWIMVATAVGCAGLCVCCSARSRRFQPLGVCLLASDMLWSGIDMSIAITADRRNGPSTEIFGGSGGMHVCFSF